MKITYPECQIEIDVDEFIELMDYMERNEPKVEIRHEFGPLKMPEIQKFEISEDTKKMIEETIRENFKNVSLDLLEKIDTNSHGDGILSRIVERTSAPNPDSTEKKEEDPLAGVSFDDPEPQPAPVPYPKEEEPAPLESTKGRNHASTKKEDPTTDSTKKKKASGKPKKVDILFENGWKTFNSISQAAKSIDARLNHLSHALLNGKTCNGHHVRYHSEMDDIMAEIKERDRKPYETSKPIR